MSSLKKNIQIFFSDKYRQNLLKQSIDKVDKSKIVQYEHFTKINFKSKIVFIVNSYSTLYILFEYLNDIYYHLNSYELDRVKQNLTQFLDTKKIIKYRYYLKYKKESVIVTYPFFPNSYLLNNKLYNFYDLEFKISPYEIKNIQLWYTGKMKIIMIKVYTTYHPNINSAGMYCLGKMEDLSVNDINIDTILSRISIYNLDKYYTLNKEMQQIRRYTI